MICDVCCKKEAFFVIRNSNLSFNLCLECAKKYDCTSLGKKAGDEIEKKFEAISKEVEKMKRACPVCGTKASDVIIYHKTGCSECYEFFLDEISEYFKSIGMNVSQSKQFDEALLEKSKKRILLSSIEKFKEKMQEAIVREDYEKAALYRDKIASLKQSLNSNFDSVFEDGSKDDGFDIFGSDFDDFD